MFLARRSPTLTAAAATDKETRRYRARAMIAFTLSSATS
jgi:hypothetical protein